MARTKRTKTKRLTTLAAIAALLLSRCPTQISGFVMRVVINSVKRMFDRWAPTDFYKKFLERIKAKFNAASAVIGKGVIRAIVASLLGARISLIFGRNLIVGSFAVRLKTLIRFALQFGSQTTARFCAFAFQGITQNCYDNAAFALANPQIITSCIRATGIAKNRQATKFLSGQIGETPMLWHWLKYNVKFRISHLISTSLEIELVRLVELFPAILRAVFILPHFYCRRCV